MKNERVVTASNGEVCVLERDQQLFETLRLRTDEALLVGKLDHVKISENMRLFYAPCGDRAGFDAIGVRYVASGRGADPWSDPELVVEVLVQVKAHFDGVVHLHVGADDGYVNCPHVETLAALFQQLARLEQRFCRDAPEREVERWTAAPLRRSAADDREETEDADYIRSRTWTALESDDRGSQVLARLKAAVVAAWRGCSPKQSAHDALRAVDAAALTSVDNLAGLAVRQTVFALGVVADGEGWYAEDVLPAESRRQKS